MVTVFLLRKPGRKVYKLGKPIGSKDKDTEIRARNLKHKMISKNSGKWVWREKYKDENCETKVRGEYQN